jgi:hypothetical protein
MRVDELTAVFWLFVVYVVYTGKVFQGVYTRSLFGIFPFVEQKTTSLYKRHERIETLIMQSVIFHQMKTPLKSSKKKGLES